MVSVLLSTGANAQFLKAYTPAGKKISIEWRTLNDLYDSLKVEDPELFFTKGGQVVFEKFTKKPIAVLFDQKVDVSKIPLMISSYSKPYNDYLLSYSFYHDLKDMIEKGTLTPDKISWTFGKPDITSTTDDGDTTKIYKRFNLSIDFNGKPLRANVLNYAAIDMYDLMIGEYDVTGEDYTIGFNISLHNTSSKRIKYTYITVTAYNDVDDIVAKKTVTAVGPIESGGLGSYEFEDIIYSTIASSLKINSIKIQYMDGSQKAIPRTVIKSISYYDWEEIGQKTF